VTANGDVATIDFAPSSLVLTKHLTFVGADQPLTLNNLRTDLSNTTVTLDYGANGPWAQRISIDGDIRVDAARVEHPQLLPQTWNFQGRAKGRLADLRVQGTLASESGFTADLDIQLNPEGGVSVAIDSVIDGKQWILAMPGCRWRFRPARVVNLQPVAALNCRMLAGYLTGPRYQGSPARCGDRWKIPGLRPVSGT
jgi:hypothetical protein